MNAKQWLLAHAYHDVIESITEVEAIWRKAGKGSRKDWWEILSGTSKGVSVKVEGITFPVLRAAQTRQGKAVTANAISKKDETPAPSKVKQARWNRE